MKIHLLPPLPLLPPAVPQKAPPNAFEIEQRTEELVEAARNWRIRRAKLSKVRQKHRRLDQPSDSEKSTADERLSEGKVNVLV